MQEEKVKDYLKKVNLEDRLLIAKQSSATVKEAALAFNTKEGQIAKTMAFWVNEKPILIVIAGDYKIDNSKYKQEFGAKAKMVEIANLMEVIGHPVGGVCPFAVNKDVDIYFDESLKNYDTVYPAGGSANSAVKIKITELEKVVPFKKWINVSKKIEEA